MPTAAIEKPGVALAALQASHQPQARTQVETWLPSSVAESRMYKCCANCIPGSVVSSSLFVYSLAGGWRIRESYKTARRQEGGVLG